MKTELVHITNENLNKISYSLISLSGTTNADSRNKMKKILYSALKSELTDKQRTCIVEHYINGRKEKDIALELNLSPSTVSRHITSAKKKLRHIAEYYN